MVVFLIPAQADWSGSGLAVRLGGLSGQTDRLEIALEDGAFQTVAREGFFSRAVCFSGLREGRLYRVTGRVWRGDACQETQVLLPAGTNQDTGRRGNFAGGGQGGEARTVRRVYRGKTDED